MAIVDQQTLLPGDDYPQRFAPIRVAAADWFTLNGNSAHDILSVTGFGGQLVNVNRVGGLSQSQVDVIVETTRNRVGKGPVQNTSTYDTETFAGLNDPTRQGPVATSRLEWTVEKQSAGSVDPYKTFLSYDIRQLTVLDKLRLGVPLTQPSETQLASRSFPGQDFTLQEREQLNLPADRDAVFEPNLRDKVVLEEATETATVDLTASDETSIVDERVETSNGNPQDVLYLTGVAGNWQETATDTEDVTLNIGNDQRKFMELKTLGLPGASGTTNNESFPPYTVDLHLPFTDRMRVWLTASSSINNIDVEVEFARVERSLVEKAIYNRPDEITAPAGTSPSRAQDIREQKKDLFDQIRAKLRAGLPIEFERRRTQEVEA